MSECRGIQLFMNEYDKIEWTLADYEADYEWIFL